MRELTEHKLTGLNDKIRIQVADEPGPGGANHRYVIWIPVRPPVGTIESGNLKLPPEDGGPTVIEFQNGPIGEAGVNGISNEALLAILIDRLRGFQFKRDDTGGFDFKSPGEYSCRENAIAITDLEDAMRWLQHRTRKRLSRGVEGTSAK